MSKSKFILFSVFLSFTALAGNTLPQGITWDTYKVNQTQIQNALSVSDPRPSIAQAIETWHYSLEVNVHLTYNGTTSAQTCNDNPIDNVITASSSCAPGGCNQLYTAVLCPNLKWIITLWRGSPHTWTLFEPNLLLTSKYEVGPVVKTAVGSFVHGIPTHGSTNSTASNVFSQYRNYVPNVDAISSSIRHTARYLVWRSSAQSIGFYLGNELHSDILLGPGGYDFAWGVIPSSYNSAVGLVYRKFNDTAHPFVLKDFENSAVTEIFNVTATNEAHNNIVYDDANDTWITVRRPIGGTPTVYTSKNHSTYTTSFQFGWGYASYGIPVATTVAREHDYNWETSSSSVTSSIIQMYMIPGLGTIMFDKTLIDANGNTTIPSYGWGSGDFYHSMNGGQIGNPNNLVRSSGPMTVACNPNTSTTSTAHNCSLIYPDTTASRVLREIKFRIKFNNSGVLTYDLYSSAPASLGVFTPSIPKMTGPGYDQSGHYLLVWKGLNATVYHQDKANLGASWTGVNPLNMFTYYPPDVSYNYQTTQYYLTYDTTSCPPGRTNGVNGVCGGCYTGWTPNGPFSCGP
jgi:hypothetical protein